MAGAPGRRPVSDRPEPGESHAACSVPRPRPGPEAACAAGLSPGLPGGGIRSGLRRIGIRRACQGAASGPPGSLSRGRARGVGSRKWRNRSGVLGEGWVLTVAAGTFWGKRALERTVGALVMSLGCHMIGT
jgi:hypothetical protein